MGSLELEVNLNFLMSRETLVSRDPADDLSIKTGNMLQGSGVMAHCNGSLLSVNFTGSNGTQISGHT